MKLRIKGDSLRFRIARSEVARLAEEGRIEETVHFGAEESARLTYAVERTNQSEAVRVRYRQGELCVLLSEKAADEWIRGEEVGIYGSIAFGQGALELSIEKDFACLDRSDADNVDTFPHPRQSSIC